MCCARHLIYARSENLGLLRSADALLGFLLYELLSKSYQTTLFRGSLLQEAIIPENNLKQPENSGKSDGREASQEVREDILRERRAGDEVLKELVGGLALQPLLWGFYGFWALGCTSR